MSEKWMHIRKWLIGVSCCALLLGLTLVIHPQISAAVLCRILGTLSIGAGIYETVRYFRLGFAGLFFRLDLILGICNILIGVVLFLPFGGATFLPFAAGLYVLVGSIFNVQLAINTYRYRMGPWVATLIIGIVGLIFSVFLFADPFHGTAALMAFMGISLIVSGIQGFYDAACLSKAIKISDGPKISDGTEIIDVEWRQPE